MIAKIKPGRPPNYKEIVAVFPAAAGGGTLFAYDDTIYVSSGNMRIPDYLVAHETVHLERQQKIGVKEWWDKYLTEHDFRYYEELLGHIAEYERITKFNTSIPFKRKALKTTVQHLANPLYKFRITKEQIEQDILKGTNNV